MSLRSFQRTATFAKRAAFQSRAYSTAEPVSIASNFFGFEFDVSIPQTPSKKLNSAEFFFRGCVHVTVPNLHPRTPMSELSY